MLPVAVTRSLRSSILVALVALPACNIVVLGEDTDGASTTATSDQTGSGGSTGAVSGESGNAPTTGEPGDPTDSGDPTGGGACDFAGVIQPIFTASCGCHGGAEPAQGLSLAEGSAYAALVGVASTQQPDLLRVQAGAPDASYLIHKLEGTAAVGVQMPFGGELAAAQIDTIAAWIAAGAPEVETFTCPGGASGDVGQVVIEVDGPIQVQVGEIVVVEAIVTTPEGEPLPAAALTWSSSAELALYVDGAGVLLGVSPGTVELRAHSGGVESAPIMVEVVAHVPAAATFTQVRAVTDAGCAVAGCHVDGVEPGDLRFDREPDKLWEELLQDGSEEVPGLARVEAGAPEASYMVQKLVQRMPAVGGQMPLGGAPMAASEVQVIVRWILAGALND
jgi:hypothetical protein